MRASEGLPGAPTRVASADTLRIYTRIYSQTLGKFLNSTVHNSKISLVETCLQGNRSDQGGSIVVC